LDVLLIAGVVLGAGLISWVGSAGGSAHPMINETLEPLRTAFNAEPDNVRAILLASPT
jgi:hypothetical protein